MGLPRTALHLDDAALVACRDGLCDDDQQFRHLQSCPFCQELLASWEAFGRAIADAVPRPSTDDAELVEVELYDRHLLSEEALPDFSEDVEFATYAYQAPSQIPVSPKLPPMPAVEPPTELGRLDVFHRMDGELRLRFEAQGEEIRARRPMGRNMPPEVPVPFPGGVMNLSARRAGHQVFLVARLIKVPRSTPYLAGEMTLIPHRGTIRVQPLDHGHEAVAGMAWFELPPGSADLFLHGPVRARIRVESMAEPAPGSRIHRMGRD